MTHPLDGFFNPHAVAVIGASADPDKLGGRPIRFFREAGFAGEIYPVNSRSAEIQGFKAYASVTDIPGPVDHAMLILPAEACLPALEACAQKGIGFVQVLSSGFGELGAHGLARQQALLDVARAGGIRLIGPNCLGVVSVRNRFWATFSTALEALVPTAGGIAVATQSGAFGSCAYAMAIQRGLGLSRIVATGNEADVDVAACIDFLAEDPETQVICAAIEGCGDGDRLRRALRKAASCAKPVIIMKVGTTEIGIAAAATHTGTLAGNDAVFDAVFTECGAWRAHSIEEMLDIAEYCTTLPAPANSHAGIITVSGGIGILMADAAQENGLSLPTLPPAASAALARLLPFAPLGNPFDTTAQVSAVKEGVAQVTRIMLEETDSATLILYLAQLACAPVKFEPTRLALAQLRKTHPERCIVLVGPSDAGVRARLIDDGFVVMTDPTRAVVAAGAVATLNERRRRLLAQAADADGSIDAGRVGDPDRPQNAALTGIGNEADTKTLLAGYGIPMLPERACKTTTEAVAAATAIGFPVVAKILSPDIAHKTEIGGVILGLADADAVAAAFDTLLSRARSAAPDAIIDGILIAPMAGDGVETILGVLVDPVFGPMMMFGLGGIGVELYKDVAFASAPLSHAQALALIRRVKASSLLEGWRGRPPLDIDALALALVNLSAFAIDHAATLAGVDVNPFLVKQSGAFCLDALVSLRPAG